MKRLTQKPNLEGSKVMTVTAGALLGNRQQRRLDHGEQPERNRGIQEPCLEAARWSDRWPCDRGHEFEFKFLHLPLYQSFSDGPIISALMTNG